MFLWLLSYYFDNEQQMEWFHDCPYLVKSVLLEKPIRTILNFVAALQRKSKVCIRYSSHTIFENFSKNIYKNKNAFILSQNVLYLPCVLFPLTTHLLKNYILAILHFTNFMQRNTLPHICRWKNIQVVKQVVKVDIIKEC